MASLSKETFLAHWSSATMDQLRDALAQMNHRLVAKKKDDALEEAWKVYSGAAKANPVAADVPAPAAGLKFEAKVRGRGAPLKRHRAGYVIIQGEWQELSPSPDEKQLEALKADPFIQVRIKG